MQVLVTIRTRRKILIRERFSVTIVRSLGTMLMIVDTRKMERGTRRMKRRQT